MTRTVRFGRVAAVVAWVAATAAQAQPQPQSFPDNPLIEEGIRLYNDLEYEASIDALQRALVRAENVPEQKILIFKYLALDSLVLERNEDAESAFRQLLAIQPEFELDATFSPDDRQFLEGVRLAWEAEGRPGWRPEGPDLSPVELDHDLPAQATRAEPFEVTVFAQDPGNRANRVVLAYRASGGTSFTRVAAQPRGTGWFGVIPSDAVEPPVIEYFFEALDAQGQVIANRGDPRAPLRVPVPGGGEDEGGFWTEWWFWTVVGVGVAASVAIPVGIVYGTGDGGGSSDPATVTILLCEPGVDCSP